MFHSLIAYHGKQGNKHCLNMAWQHDYPKGPILSNAGQLHNSSLVSEKILKFSGISVVF